MVLRSCANVLDNANVLDKEYWCCFHTSCYKCIHGVLFVTGPINIGVVYSAHAARAGYM